MEDYQDAKSRIATWPNNSTPTCLPTGYKHTSVRGCVHPYVPFSAIYNRQSVERTQVSGDRRVL